MATSVPARSEIPDEHTWDLSSIFATESDWTGAMERSRSLLKQLEAYRGRLNEGPDVLAEALDIFEQIWVLVGQVFTYATMLNDSDTADQSASAKRDRALALYGQTMATVSFIDPELLDIGYETLREWEKENSHVAVYDHYFDELGRRRAHVRSVDVEEVLGLASNAFETARGTHGILADADLTFTPAVSSHGDRIDVSQGNMDALLEDSDREVRRSAWESYADAHLAFQNTMASCLSGGIKQDVFRAQVHNFGSSLEAALAPANIPTEVFHNVLKTFQAHLPTWHKYWKLRRESLGYDTFHVYDIKAPMTLDKPTVPFRESVDWIVEGMKPLGHEYVEHLRRGVLEQRWVDIYPNQGKRAGAYSSGFKGTYPFILMSYTDDVGSMSTLAHELGHSMHSYYTWETQPIVYSNYSIFVAEVASNFNQALVRQYLLDSKQDPNFQIALIEEAMSNFHRYFFIMPTLARFELETHELTERGEPLTAEVLNGIMARLFKEGYGEEVVFDADRIGITWAEFPTHLYMNFYVFQYATGIAAAHALANRISEEGAPAVDRYLNFLKAGDSVYPLEALERAGVDMRSPEPVEAAFNYLDDLVERLRGLLAQVHGEASVR